MLITGCTLLFKTLLLGVLMGQSSNASDEAATCNIACSRELNPVCGEYQGIHKSFSNACMMNYFNCRRGTDFAMNHSGYCVEESDLQ